MARVVAGAASLPAQSWGVHARGSGGYRSAVASVKDVCEVVGEDWNNMNTICRHHPGCEPQGGTGRGCCVQVGDAQEEKEGAEGRDRVKLQGSPPRIGKFLQGTPKFVAEKKRTGSTAVRFYDPGRLLG